MAFRGQAVEEAAFQRWGATPRLAREISLTYYHTPAWLYRLKVRPMIVQSRSPSPVPLPHTSAPAEY